MVNETWLPPEGIEDIHISEAEFEVLWAETQAEMAELEARLGCTWAEHVNRRKAAEQ